MAAIKAAQLGLNTVCIEKRGSLGGTCLNVGCIPSKALLNISHKYHELNHDFKSFGISANNVALDWAQTMKNKDGVVTSLTKGVEGLFRKNKVTYIKGTGSFLDSKTMYPTNKKDKSTPSITRSKLYPPTTSSSPLEVTPQLFQVCPSTRK